RTRHALRHPGIRRCERRPQRCLILAHRPRPSRLPPRVSVWLFIMSNEASVFSLARHRDPPPIALSVVIPFFNEQDNAAPLVSEVLDALRGRLEFEVVCVDDGSVDDTPTALARLRSSTP